MPSFPNVPLDIRKRAAIAPQQKKTCAATLLFSPPLPKASDSLQYSTSLLSEFMRKGLRGMEKERIGKRKKKKGAEKEGDGRTECKYRKNRNKNRGRRKWRKKDGKDGRERPTVILS